MEQHQGRRGVGDAGGDGGSGYAPTQTQHKEIVQNDVDHAADDAAGEHPVGLAAKSGESLGEVGDAIENEAASDDSKVLSHKRIHFIVAAQEIAQTFEV